MRTLRTKIDGMIHERTGLSKKPEKLAKRELPALRDENRLTTLGVRRVARTGSF